MSEPKTIHELMHIELGRKVCPILEKCIVPVQHTYYVAMCNTVDYIKCYHYAKQMNDLRLPKEWRVYQPPDPLRGKSKR